MNAHLRGVFNGTLDKIVRPERLLLRRSVSAFRICGVIGLGLAMAVTLTLTAYLSLSPLVMAAVAAVATAAFLGLVMATRIVTGEEQIIYYHHEIAVMMAAALVLWVTRQPVLPYLDLTILGIGTFLFCGRVGCLMAGCCHGRPYHWGVAYGPAHCKAGFTPYLVGVRLFPIQAAESLWVLCIVVTGITFIAQGRPAGTALAWYVVSYDTARFGFEFLRGDPDRPYLLGFSQPQWISVALMCLVLWAEVIGALPFQAWHIAVTGGLILAMLAIAVKRRLQETPKYALLHPRHVREVAEALQLINSAATEARSVSGWTVFPKHTDPKTLHLARTSLGVQISAGRTRDEAGELRHYTFSCRKGQMTKETARILADIVLQLQPGSGRSELANGNQDVFHLLVRAISTKELVC